MIILTGCRKPPAEIFTINLVPRDFADVLSVRGEIFSQNEISLSVPSGVGGSVKSIPESGTSVQTGDTVVVIESRNSKKRLSEKQRRLKYIQRRIVRENRKITQEKLQNELKILEKTYALNVKKLEAKYQLGEKDPRYKVLRP